MSGEPMVELEEMAPSDARLFLADALELLVANLAQTNDWPDNVARDQARSMEARLLPKHEATAHHTFLWTISNRERSGRIWLGPAPDGRPLLYVWVIIIDESQRGFGVGTATVHDVVKMAEQAGHDGVALTVWDTNPNAKRLYERLGFVAESHGDGRSLMVRSL